MELWKNAIDTGDLAGRSLGRDPRIFPIRYFLSKSSELFGLRVQVAGNPKVSEFLEIIRGDLDRLDRETS